MAAGVGIDDIVDRFRNLEIDEQGYVRVKQEDLARLIELIIAYEQDATTFNSHD